jgi:hypothetical protein
VLPVASLTAVVTVDEVVVVAASVVVVDASPELVGAGGEISGPWPAPVVAEVSVVSRPGDSAGVQARANQAGRI